MKQPPFFQEQFGEIIAKARTYRIGKPIGEIAAKHADKIGLSTLKAVEAGRHIRSEQMKIVRKLYAMKPLDWIETKVRYIEHYLEEYLVPSLDGKAHIRLDGKLVEKFFDLRGMRTRDTDSSELQRLRLQVEVTKAFKQAATTAAEICASTGPSRSKKDRSRMSYPTVTAFERGEHIRPAKFQAIYRTLKLPRSTLCALKIAYAESFLGEFLLGEEEAVFKKSISPVNYPRTVSLLIYSTENAVDLA